MSKIVYQIYRYDMSNESTKAMKGCSTPGEATQRVNSFNQLVKKHPGSIKEDWVYFYRAINES